jgi:hypothetical protein
LMNYFVYIFPSLGFSSLIVSSLISGFFFQKLETLHEDHKDLIDGAINHTKNKTVKFSTKKVTFLPNSIFISVFSKFRNCSWSGELKT